MKSRNRIVVGGIKNIKNINVVERRIIRYIKFFKILNGVKGRCFILFLDLGGLWIFIFKRKILSFVFSCIIEKRILYSNVIIFLRY